MERLLEYYMQETDKKIGEMRVDLKESIAQIYTQLDDLKKFKIEMMVTARFTSVIISSICGFISIIVSAYVSWRLASFHP